jgi:carbon monoxide dehydrogenase subunit G
MPKIERNIAIEVPVENVFSYISDPMKLLEWLPSLFDVRNVTGEGVNQQFSWTYKMMGIPLKGVASYTEYKPRERIVIKTTGNINSSWTFTFKPQADMTLASLEIDYALPMPLLGKIGERLILRQNEREAELAVANIKERLEWRDRFKYRNTGEH